MVRRSLEVIVEEEAHPLEERMKEQLVNIVKQCQTELFTMFQGLSASVGENNASTSARRAPVIETRALPGGQLQEESFPHFETFSSSSHVPAISASYTANGINAESTREGVKSSDPCEFTAIDLNGVANKYTSDSPDSGYGSSLANMPFHQNLEFGIAQLLPDNGVMDQGTTSGDFNGLWPSEHQAFECSNLFDPSMWLFDGSNAMANANGF